MTERLKNEKGQFIKGVSGNPSGVSKKSKLSKVDKDEIIKMIEDRSQPSLASDFLIASIRKCETIEQAHKYMKEYLNYLTPKKASAKEAEIKDNSYNIIINGFEGNNE